MFTHHNKEVGFLFGTFKIRIICIEVVFSSMDQSEFEGVGLLQSW